MKQCSYLIQEALDWNIQGSLRHALVDEAEKDLKVQGVHGSISIEVQGDEFVATFEPAEG